MQDGYTLATARHDAELARLGIIEAAWDPKTRRHLLELGVGPGDRCLELGAGAGGVARWLAGQVGEGGHVVAADIDPRFLAGELPPNLEVRRLDIVADALEEAAFDVVHARLLLIHLADPAAALRKMIAALRPGGVLLVEESSGVPSRGDPSWPGAAAFDRAEARHMDFLRALGVDIGLGARLPGLLVGLGLADVGGEETGRLLRSGPQVALKRETLQAYRRHMLDLGAVSEADLDAHVALLADPALLAVEASVIAVWGRRPA